jgi:3-dehydrotetronate 4-kinase
MLLGCIADDLTGATDLALMLSRGGMRTYQLIGVPEKHNSLDADAVVVALKSRTIPPDEAVAQSLAAARALTESGARQLFFKYCSTFDSTDQGNIGPVADALLNYTAGGITIACPAFPANGRTIYQGHLFVGKQLLSDSSMRDHPLTPMRDSNLVRVLQRQAAGQVGLIAHETVAAGADAIRAALREAERQKISFMIVDALTDADLHSIGRAVADLPLITGGSGIGIGLPDNFRKAGLLQDRADTSIVRAPPGRALILSGSCSAATMSQVAHAKAAGIPALQITAAGLADNSQRVTDVVSWAVAQKEDRPVLVYSSAPAEEVRATQARMGRESSAELIEQAFGQIAKDLTGQGFTRLIVAGGETSGAVVTALGVRALAIGPEIDPGVPWTSSLDGPQLALALKSGNFGAADFFTKAWGMLS